MSARTFGCALLSCAVLSGCSDDSTEPARGRQLTLALQGLEPLLNGFHYEAWAIVGGQPLPAGKFNLDGQARLVDLNGGVIANGTITQTRDISASTMIVLTIEPSGDRDATPTNTHVLAGAVQSGTANLSVAPAAALGSDFATAAASYILATPTDGGSNTNERSGVWFLSLASGSPAAGLTLPTLPAGWIYEGWAVVGGRPLTTGRFLNPRAADMSAPYSGTTAGPPFPGEDYLRNAPSGLTFPLDLRGATVAITIEPEPDDSPAPFAFKPLLGTVAATSVDHVTYTLPNRASTLATGTATIR
ncbi:MAG: hypothetical protein ACT4P6_20570 [Gemmatimonadaceae bacterium]